ncbi:MAG: SPOR domain-containing protein [Gemmatimonadales bacterium]
MNRGTLVLAVGTLWIAVAGHAGAQTSGSGVSELDRAQALADSGRTDAARASLDAWYGASEAPGPVELSRARLLRARLASDPDSAELDYVWVTIEGDAAHAPEALLRLAQLRLLRGEPERALADLERLRSSHPEDPRIGESWLWTGHAHEALGELEAACAAWRRAEPADSVTRPAVTEALKACEEGGAVFAVQVGAFGETSGAETVRRRLESAGFETYVVTNGEDGLHRVRTGRFMHLTSAALYAERVRRHGFEAVVVLSAPASG